jgi:hypothetical protein
MEGERCHPFARSMWPEQREEEEGEETGDDWN